jgi:hypothetical protein
MQGVPFPVLGVSDIGHTQIMYPGQDYNYYGSSVTEYPMMQYGGSAIEQGKSYDIKKAPAELLRAVKEFQDMPENDPQIVARLISVFDKYKVPKIRRPDGAIEYNLHNIDEGSKQSVQKPERVLTRQTFKGVPYNIAQPQINVAAPIGRTIEQYPTNYSVTFRDENSPSKQRTQYFPDLQSWRNFTDNAGYMSREQTADGRSAQALGYNQFAEGGQHGGLDRWFAEKWVDIKTGKPCGRQEGESRKGYPACRPSRRINDDTPKTASELSSAERERFKRSKTSSERINYQHHRKEYGGETTEHDMANKPNNPSLWSRAKSLAKQKFDVYPSAYANGWAAKWYKGHGGTWHKAEYGMEVPSMAEGGKPDWLVEAQLKAQGYSGNALQQKMSSMAQGGEPQNSGFQALPEYVQQKIMANAAYGGYIPEMAAGGWAQQAATAIAMKKAGKRPKQMKDGGDPDGEMALGQIDAAIMKLQQLRKFIQPDSDLEPWVNSKITLMDDYASSVSDYMMHNPEAQEKMQNGGGLWNTNRTQWVDSVNNANMNKNFVQREYWKNGPSIQIPGQPGRSTHFMEESDGMVYPTVVQMPNGKLQYLNLNDKDGAYNYAKKTGQFIKFPTVEQAMWYGGNGYKTGTGVTIGKKQEGGELDEMKDGGIPQRYKNMGFTHVGQKMKGSGQHKWKVLAKKGDQYKVVQGGWKGMEDFSQHHSEKRRERFWDRMGGKNSSKAKDPFSPLYWHKRFGTWAEGGEIDVYEDGGSTNSAGMWYQKGGEPRSFWQTASQFIPVYETYLDIKDMIQGAAKGNKAQMNQGVIGMGQPFAGKAISGGIDYITEKLLGKEVADEIAAKREDIVNMSDADRIKLFKKYGFGGYDKWVKDGKPRLKEGGIHINPANKGKFTASAQHAGMGVQEFAAHVLANKEDYSSTQVKRANFARNASKWKHQDGGPVVGQELDVTPQQLEMLRQQGYQFEII